MGDRSPKSVQKQTTQKKSKATAVTKKKQELIVSKQAVKAKASAKKK
jgi:hypothetical protein